MSKQDVIGPSPHPSPSSGTRGRGGIAVIVPMKPLREAKSRLRGVLDDDGRAALSLLMLERVLRSSRGNGEPRRQYVVGGDDLVRRLSGVEGALTRPDPGGDLNDAIAEGARFAFGAGADAVLVLPGDLALLAGNEVDALVEASAGLTRAVLSAARRDGGTNAILAPRGMFVRPRFGPLSFARHLEVFGAASIPVEVVQRAGLDFDLDTPADLSFWFSTYPKPQHALQSWRRHIQEAAFALARQTPGAQA